ncbi:NAD-dependent epimerase/dehydratase family protein [Mucisphaera sp.]|uniref:NAD-dependent epimerase/dehydratase family protein n=1 Tax=Mucisphaera sp. TaxID=2913024 RepID=UPI003D112D9F
MPTPVLIIGCGYLGRRLAARLRDAGHTVYATARTEAKARELARLGLHPCITNVTQPLTLTAIQPALDLPELAVAYLVPPGRAHPGPETTVREGIANTARALRNTTITRAILTSSTAVYGQTDNSRITAATPANPAHDRGKLLLEGEHIWQSANPNAHAILRLAGLYGPDRIIGLDAIRTAAPLLGDPNALLNLIHVDDAAALLQTLLTNKSLPPATDLAADGHPPTRIDYYTHLANRLGSPPPRILSPEQAQAELNINPKALRRAGSKHIDPSDTINRTGWQPQYPTYKAGLDHALAQ